MEWMKASELIEKLKKLVEDRGDQVVGVKTEEGAFPATDCYYDPIAESIFISE